MNITKLKETTLELAYTLRDEVNKANLKFYIPDHHEPEIDLNIPSITWEGCKRGTTGFRDFRVYYNPETKAGRGAVLHVSSDMDARLEEFWTVKSNGFHQLIGAMKDDSFFTKKENK